MSSKLKATLVAVLVGGAALAARALRESLRASTDQEAPMPSPPPGPGVGDASRAPRGDAGVTTTPDLSQATRAELYEEAKHRGIAGRSRMTKAELREALGER